MYYNTILYYTALLFIILYNTIIYYSILFYTILYFTLPYRTILCYTILYHIILYCIILSYPILYCCILYYTILYYATLYYIILYYVILYYSIVDYTVPQSAPAAARPGLAAFPLGAGFEVGCPEVQGGLRGGHAPQRGYEGQRFPGGVTKTLASNIPSLVYKTYVPIFIRLI